MCSFWYFLTFNPLFTYTYVRKGWRAAHFSRIRDVVTLMICLTMSIVIMLRDTRRAAQFLVALYACAFVRVSR